MTTNPALRIAAPVQEALASGTPVVALESTIFTHGLPRPRNVEVALAGEEIIRAAGGVPATIGVVHGQPVVGLTADEINELGYDDNVTKASIRDLSYAAVTKKERGHHDRRDRPAGPRRGDRRVRDGRAGWCPPRRCPVFR